MNNLSLSVNVIIVGMVVVFVSLVLLTYIIVLANKILNAVKGSSGNNRKTSGNISVQEISGTRQINSSDGDLPTDELIAVITAAIMASGNTNPGYNIRLKSFRRIPQTTPVWNIAGRNEYIAGKL
ncbi:MAG TPA: oxaloacetate decarboxylase, gamma chain [Clostridiaceae bacterium]|nr:oxaloacetate decarboxylase, gamma chain [Clostridiaceae bacterium]